VVEVRHDQFPFVDGRQWVKHLQKHHGIESARDRCQNGLARAEKASRTNGLVNGLDQFVHCIMLLTPHREASDLSATGPALAFAGLCNCLRQRAQNGGTTLRCF
jgi:hypothetical protein